MDDAVSEALNSLYSSKASLQNDGLLQLTLLAPDNTRAQYELGRYYVNIAPQDEKHKAFQYFTKAAAKDDARALNGLGVCHEHGYGTPVNEKLAFQYYERSAKAGFFRAMHNLALCYYEGLGCPQNTEKAIAQFKAAASLGMSDSLLMLSRIYSDGVGINHDKEESQRYLREAANAGNTQAMILLGISHTDANNDQDWPRAMEWFGRASERGDTTGMVWLGYGKLRGIGTTQNTSEAIPLLETAATYGSVDAIRLLVSALQGNYGIERDDEAAAKWLSTEAAQSDADSVYTLARMHEAGINGKKRPDLAFRSYLRAAELGHSESACSTAVYYLAGTNIEKNEQEGVRWMKIAADRGSDQASLNFAIMYRDGVGVEKNDELMNAWIDDAASKGNATAIQWRTFLQEKAQAERDARLREEQEEQRRIQANKSSESGWDRFMKGVQRIGQFLDENPEIKEFVWDVTKTSAKWGWENYGKKWLTGSDDSKMSGMCYCPTCRGHGVLAVPDSDDQVRCRTCYGYGTLKCSDVEKMLKIQRK